MPEYIESICRSCFHSYVCEQFNIHRDSHNEKCHFYNDHFVSAADVVAVVRCKDCKYYGDPAYGDMCKRWEDWLPTEDDDFCSYGERRDEDGN